MSKLPTLLPYPPLITLADFPGIQTMFCYIIEHYGHDGLALMVNRSDDRIDLQMGNWDGDAIDLSEDSKEQAAASLLLHKHGEGIARLMHTIGITQAILYFAMVDDDYALVDVRSAFNRFTGPGMVKDIFGAKMFETQKVIKIEHITPELYERLLDGTGIYDGNLIIKPSRFRNVTINKQDTPLYAEVVR